MSPKYFLPHTQFKSLVYLNNSIILCLVILIVEAVTVLFNVGKGLNAYLNFLPTPLVDPTSKWIIENKSIFSGVFYIMCILAILWLGRAYRNLYVWDIETANTPNNVMIESIIPIVNIKSVYVHLREIWQGTVNKDNWTLIKIWLGLSLAGLSMKILIKSDIGLKDHLYGMPDDFEQSNTLTLIAGLLMIVFYIVSIKLIYVFTRVQEEKVKYISQKHSRHKNAIKVEPETITYSQNWHLNKVQLFSQLNMPVVALIFFLLGLLFLIYVL